MFQLLLSFFFYQIYSGQPIYHSAMLSQLLVWWWRWQHHSLGSLYVSRAAESVVVSCLARCHFIFPAALSCVKGDSGGQMLLYFDLIWARRVTGNLRACVMEDI